MQPYCDLISCDNSPRYMHHLKWKNVFVLLFSERNNKMVYLFLFFLSVADSRGRCLNGTPHFNTFHQCGQ